MTDDYYQINLRRLESLLSEEEEVEKAYREKREQLQSLSLRIEALGRLMKAEIFTTGNNLLQKQLDKILDRSKSANKNEPKQNVLNKTEFLIRILFNENLGGRGVKPKALFDLAQSSDKDVEISLSYVNSVLSKLRKDDMAEQRNKEYFLTEKGREHWSRLLS